LPDSIQELSEALSEDTSLENVEDISVSTTTTIEFEVTASSSDSTLDDMEVENTSLNTTTVMNLLPSVTQLLQFSTTTETKSESEPVSTATEDEEIPTYVCRNTNIVKPCDELDGGNTTCRLHQVKVAEHEVTKYAPGWESVDYRVGEMAKGSWLKRIAEFIGLGPDRKDVPDSFEVRAHTLDTYEIAPGETLFFKMNISYPPFSNGEYWIEAVGNSEYGLLDPFWSSKWLYRIPIQIDNSNGTEDLTEQQIFFELDSTLSDFWSNVNSDGSDIRFVQELPYGNLNNRDTAINNWFDFDWSHRIAIEIPAYSVDTDLDNFPVYINLGQLDNNFWSNVKSDGGDIRVTLTDGTFYRLI